MAKGIEAESRGLSKAVISTMDNVDGKLFFLPSYLIENLEELLIERGENAADENGFDSDGDIDEEFLDENEVIASLLNHLFNVRQTTRNFKVTAVFEEVTATDEEEAMELIRNVIGYHPSHDYELEVEQQ
jgi:hypothetical protein